MSRFRHPEGSRLPGLERNILKYRAFEMVLMLFYVEELKDFVVGAVRATRRWRDDENKNEEERRGVNFKRATNALLADGVLSDPEKQELVALVDFRNDIAHRIHELTFDVARSTYSHEYREFITTKYDYGALKRVKFFREELRHRMRGKYVFEMSMDSLLFEGAEKTYQTELKRLRKKVDQQIKLREAKMKRLRVELSLDGLLDDLHPYHPMNVKRNENLSERGIEVAYRLFDAGKIALAVAWLMHISSKAANRHRKNWIKAGGKKREQRELPPLIPARRRKRTISA